MLYMKYNYNILLICIYIVFFFSLRELFKIGKYTNPETISPEIDDTAQNNHGQENGDIVEENPTTGKLNTLS